MPRLILPSMQADGRGGRLPSAEALIRTPLRRPACGLALALAVAGVAAQPAAQPGATADSGRDLFQANCARCHGADATGTADAPNLLQRIKGMSEDRFSSTVLRRYAWTVPSSESGSEAAVRQAMLRGLLEPRSTAAMPAWEGNAAVANGVKEIFGYLQGEAGRATR
jgi:mono/diheme cytochrome c family protein